VSTGRGYWAAGVALSLTLASHLLPWMYALVAAAILVVLELAQRRGHGDPREVRVRGDLARPVRFAVGAGLISAGLSAWWALSFATTQSLTNSMGYTNDATSTIHQIFTTLGWWTSSGTPAGDRWAIVLAAAGAVVALATRDRLGVVLTSLTVGSLVAFVYDPQSVLFNERLVPFWFLGIHLLAGWLVGFVAWRWVQRQRRLDLALAYADDEQDEFAHDEVARDEVAGDEVAGDGVGDFDAIPTSAAADRRADWYEGIHRTRVLNATSIIILLGLLSTVPGLVPGVAKVLHLNTSGNQVTNWSAYNYSGYQAKAAWPEYHDLMTTMSEVAARDGCGRAMWEYNSSESRFGTPMALMLLPYWTKDCVDSMEGLYFESSATTPYHFLNQAELSQFPSDPQVGLNYGSINVTEGVTHLQMLGVKYYIAFSPAIIAQAKFDPALHLVATTRAWPAPGVRWYIYRIADSPLVTPLRHTPVVVAGIAGRTAWLQANVNWWLNPTAWDVPLASDGPAAWPHVSAADKAYRSALLPRVTITHVRSTSQSISFRVSRVGVPVLVKISYYPRWHASGAAGPYRVSPNLMVVIPSATTVSLTYGASAAVAVGDALTGVTALVGLGVAGVALRRRRRVRQ
jgi:hypothetical protein